MQFGPYRLIPSKRLLLVGQERVELGSRAFDILLLLLQRRGEVVSRRELLDQVWPDLTVEESNLRVQISELRRALDACDEGSSFIRTVPGRGYLFVAPVQAVSSWDVPTSLTNSTLGRLPLRQRRPVGRDHALDALARQTLARRFVSIVGPGGIGKTTLAVELGYRLMDEFDNEVCYVDLGALDAPGLVLPAIGAALGYTPNSEDLPTELLSFVGNRRLLLVVDCCEHVVEAVADAASMLFQEAQSIHLVATSREPLRVEGETIYFADPLGLPAVKENLTATEALTTASVELFMQCANAGGYARKLDDRHARAVAEICHALDGNALAIELAGSRLNTYGFEGLLERLRGPALLGWLGRRHQPRHRNLEALLDWSFRLLSDVERRVLARLSVFAGTFTMQSAQAVASDAVDDQWAVAHAIEQLIDKSLIAICPADDAYLYGIPNVTRLYAEVKLAQSGELEEIRRRCTQLCVQLSQGQNVARQRALAGAAARCGYRLAEAAARCGYRVDELRAALEWCLSDLDDIKLEIDLAAHAFGLPAYISVEGSARLAGSKANYG
jgi:predicted ATPase/DNA-binding winged helix-turn-helix (wHTH) protein